jgi:hypothetical protein
MMATQLHGPEATAGDRISTIIAGLGDWRGAALHRVRALITEAVPDVVEEIKWVKPSNPAGVPTWSHGGIICTGEIYAAHVKVTFMSGASLADPGRLFNSSLGAGTRRAIDLRPGDDLDAGAFQALVRAAAEGNAAQSAAAKATSKPNAESKSTAVARRRRPASGRGH